MIDPNPPPLYPHGSVPSVQVEVSDYYLPSVEPFRCAGCRNVRFAAWRFTGLCDHCVPPPAGGFRCYDGEAPREPVTSGYTPSGTAVPPPPNTLPPHLQIGGQYIFRPPA